MLFHMLKHEVGAETAINRQLLYLVVRGRMNKHISEGFNFNPPSLLKIRRSVGHSFLLF